MLVLGWHGGVKSREMEDFGVGYSSHDGAAVLLRDGEVVAAIEEERLNRVKHSNFFPARAIRFCLDQAGVTLKEVDFIAVDAMESTLDAFIAFYALNSPTEPFLSGRQWLAALFEREFRSDVSAKIRFCKHHEAHLYGVVYPSGYPRCLAVGLDGEGDGRSGLIATFDGRTLTPLKEYNEAQSLGNFYTGAISLLGYRRFDEYKVMGLAPYGDPNAYQEMFEQFYTLLPDGDFAFIPPGAQLALAGRYGLLKHVRRKGQPFTQVHKDLAAGIQNTLERIAFHILRHFRKSTGEKNLCVSGGVAHNCTLNGKVLYANLFEQMFVQPAAHDAGNALGAALVTSREEGLLLKSKKLPHVYWGTNTNDDAWIQQRVALWQNFIKAERQENIASRTADLLAEGAVVGWVQGRSEFGPRALGNRSILADPRPAHYKQLINEMVKKREGYRPFAPSVLEERLQEYFDVPERYREFPFMIFVLRVREEKREILGAVTHVDGTARVQTVSRLANPQYYDLINEFDRRTGVPVLLNTSFNNHAEPIVDSVEDAIVCFLTTGIHYLVIGNYLITKRNFERTDPVYRSLVPSLRPNRKLGRRRRPDSNAFPAYMFTIESTANSFFSQPLIEISPELFGILLAEDESTSVAEHCATQAITDPKTLATLSGELVELWEQRAIILTPKASKGFAF